MESMPRKRTEPKKTGTKELSNGATYSYDLGRIIANPGGGTKAITSERSLELHQLRRERKRAVVQAAANEAVENMVLRRQYGDDAYIAALVQAAMIKATNIDDPKMIDAARFVMQESGQAETANDAQPSATQDVRAILSGLVDLARELRQAATLQQTDNTTH